MKSTKPAVYFVQIADGRIKIGFSRYLPGRLEQLRQLYGRADLIAAMPADLSLECAVHRLFFSDRIENEVFRASAAIISAAMSVGIDQSLMRCRPKKKTKRQSQQYTLAEVSAAAREMAALGRAKMSPERRKEIARAAIAKRWEIYRAKKQEATV